MTESHQPAELTEFDAAAVGEAIEAVAGDGLRAFVEYDAQTYNPLQVRDDVVEELGGEESFGELADQLHADFSLDFTQQELYEEVYGELGTVRAFVVVMDRATVLRFVGEQAGLYVSMDPEVSIQAVLDAVEEVVDRE